MLNLFLPNKHVNSIFDVTPEFLQTEGKKGIIVDLDNTLVPWNVEYATEEVINWLKKMKDANIKVTIFSNNNEDRVTVFSEPLKTPFVFKANKPLKRAFKQVNEQMQLNRDEIVVIGDQLLTDILGGNRAGFYTILVVPIVQSDAPITKFNRNMERLILNYFYRKGKLTRRMTGGE
ncbi:YqeG family HAD IIIA-type phosphatase [Pseudogracilibacillus sp. SE30717A]|uniref:YqeG family HAD IIIA-type phosphatase n=1 Tax=Pseudogracilibacillus sp. SE30717A TaxID=3098293 RepID=UPI00300E2D8B